MRRLSHDSSARGAPVLGALALITLVAAAACGGAGDKASGGSAQATPAPNAAQTASVAGTAPAADQGPNGPQLFQRCAVCHQATGQVIAGSFPPLAGSEWANAENVAVPIRIVLHGLQGQITVKGQRYNSVMPAYGTGAPMNDADVAAVVSYVRSAWGNKSSAVTAAQVATERSATASHSGAWTAKDLQPLLAGGGGH